MYNYGFAVGMYDCGASLTSFRTCLLPGCSGNCGLFGSRR